MDFFLKEHMRHLIDGSRTDLSELEKLDLKICNQGADRIYMHLFNSVVRKGWVDPKGYPVKKLFYDNGLLACCISVRTLANRSVFGNMKVQKLVNSMESLNWIRKEKRYTRKGQTIYVLGKWKYGKDKNDKKIIIETLFRDESRDNYIKEKVDKPKENDYSEYNFDNIYR